MVIPVKNIKSFLLGLGGILFSLHAMANKPDSVWVRPDIQDGAQHLDIAYSADLKHWTHVYRAIFSSDYGPWGEQKKMWYPVIRFDEKTKKFHATFIPNLKTTDVAYTESENFTLWKPQDYKFLSAEEYNKILAQSKADWQKPIRVPYLYIENLLNRKRLADQNAAWERENYVATGSYLAADKGDVKATLNINWQDTKPISPNLMGIFFEDISYAADGGLYAELIQNRDFEYTADDHRGWNALTAWTIEGDMKGRVVKDSNPISQYNANALCLNVTNPQGCRLINEGWDGIVLKAKAKYNFSMFLKGKTKMRVSLVEGNRTLASCTVIGAAADSWKQCKATLIPSADAVQARLVIEPLTAGEATLDFISLFPQDTFRGHKNGLRKDLAEVIANLKPRFVRFPGGCASHGNGINNIYHWQATVGELWDRQPDYNIWHYHQTRGLGFYEYFQFCEDLNAEPLPVLSAGVPCQNSGRGGYEGGPQYGQQEGIPFLADLNGKPSPYKYMGKDLTMESYLQELLDLIEWANGDPKTSALAALRAKAGHPKPFNLKYLGIGNEDLLGDTFYKRYNFLAEGVKAKHPEITIVGTVGPFWEGSDYEYGWKAAKEQGTAIVDEHYYNTPGWYFHHRDYYDDYQRSTSAEEKTKVYLGEWASKGNQVSNALVEAAYLTNVERNADVVVMSSYAPLLAKDKHHNWTPDMIYFSNTEINPSANYDVQMEFGNHAGDTYVYSDLSIGETGDKNTDSHRGDMLFRLDKSVVVDSKTGDIIIKLVSLMPKAVALDINLGQELVDQFTTYKGKKKVSEPRAFVRTYSGGTAPDKTRQWESQHLSVTNQVASTLNTILPGYSMQFIRISKK